jgi:PAS domain S-box-containing protein
MFGYRSEEVVGKNVSMLMPEPYHSEHDGYLGRYLRTGQAKIIGSGREVAGRRSDGGVFPLDLRISEFFLGGRRQFIGIMRDITERKRIAEALRASELQMRQITDTVPALMAYLDREQRFRFHNKAYEEVFGLSFEQVNDRPLAEVLGQPAYKGVRDKVEEVLRGYPVRYEGVHVTAQGDIRNYAMHYFPRYGEGEGEDEGKVIGFFSLGTDITELKRIDRMKTEFISTVSHELRTPLTSIRGSLGLIAGGVAGEVPEAVKNLVGIAKNNCERLIRLINDILDSEKIESGKMSLDLQVVDIRQLVQQTLAAIEGFAGQHRVKVRLQAPDAPLQVRIDSDRLIQVLTNLLSNAVKFSPPERMVEVRVLRVAHQVRVEVADHGPGIPEEFRGRIFQKFSQADSSDTRQKGGTGLGLNISRALIEKMGGQIGFSSEAGVGTTFFLELPEWQNPAPLLQPVRTRAVFSRPRILVCEGDPNVARLISMMLKKAGFEADIAHHATQAQACLARNNYDAVTVDLKLPGQCGAAFISALRGDERTHNLPVVVISAMVEEGQLQFNRKPLAVSGWLEKPIDENLLILNVRRAVAGLESGKPRILHVEDDPDVQCIVAAIAQDFADFEFAATLNEARARLREQHFDLVLLDLGLGEDSGWGLFEDIDALDPPPPVIVFSAGDVDPANGKQAEAVLVKARTSNTELLNTIQRVLQIPGDPGPTRPQPLS